MLLDRIIISISTENASISSVVALLIIRALYLNFINYPFFMNFDIPERVGFAHGKIRNIHIETSDGLTIGAWHVLPESVYQAAVAKYGLEIPQSVYDDALNSRPVVQYCHGNAANRAAPFRTETYRHLTTRLDLNVVAVDYRGFGDSEGIPSEQGLYEDARSVFRWIREKGTPSIEIILMGQSLGTGVVVNLASELSNAGIKFKALVTMAAYSSISDLLYQYKLLRTFPILSPLSPFPWLQNLALKAVTHKFDSASKIANVTSPILIVHGTHDAEISLWQSRKLFMSIVTKETAPDETVDIDTSLLPQLHFPIPVPSPELQLLAAAKKNGKLTVVDLASPNSAAGQTAGSVRQLKRTGKGDVWHLEVGWAGHNDVQNFDVTLNWLKKLLS